ncbi:hypothetical protein S7711_09176 [Stachybotrys chartarum IBT 7711]|uniref:Translation initiation factor 3 C-terminal domain-containing protein n=1 Tax=Stachybotrys chartarum (strain CBS 109288 / IBT 7711) TaxID=1280523 RepID=A0A084ALR9_STACB|nr:hypothetical protein S7711_09176 [Stachybotrys chartarum IBT 7711]KFA46977.1 hypothetical protein S40293_09792 [Stachybotrys chartarum IBT 40293]KFA79880.1 hypothetical protein S40288_03732 [Stachybotrys chartarum IBT 40288]
MRGSPCLCNSRRALYRVFIAPIELRETTVAPRQLLPAFHARCAPILPLHPPSLQWTRSLTNVRRPRGPQRSQPEPEEDDDDKKPSHDPRFTTIEVIRKANRDRYPKDHEITDPRIMVIDDGPPEGPHSTRYVLSKLEADESLRMVEPYKPADPEHNKPASYAVCKIVNTKAEYARRRELKERKKDEKEAGRVKGKTKMVELTWSIGDNDLQTKLRQITRFLEGGMHVDVAIGKKKQSKIRVPVEDAQAVLKKVKEEMAKVGAKEVKGQEGVVGGILRMHYGPKP